MRRSATRQWASKDANCSTDGRSIQSRRVCGSNSAVHKLGRGRCGNGQKRQRQQRHRSRRLNACTLAKSRRATVRHVVTDGIGGICGGRRMVLRVSVAVRYRLRHVHLITMPRTGHRRFSRADITWCRHSRHHARNSDGSVEDHREAEQQAHEEGASEHPVMITTSPQLGLNHLCTKMSHGLRRSLVANKPVPTNAS